MDFLKRLFGIKPDVTAEWPELPVGAPIFDVSKAQIGPLPFGAPFEAARELGKADEYKPNAGTNSSLLYARSGYILEWEESGLVYVAYFVGPDEYARKHPALAYCRPRVIAPDGTLHEFHAETDAPALVAAFGTPGGADLDEEESVLEWEIGKLTIEAELNERGRLKSLNAFLTD